MSKDDAAKQSEEILSSPARVYPMPSGEVALPALTPSRYEPLTKLLAEIDVHGQQLLRVFFRKSFAGYFELSRQFPQALLEVTEEINSSILQVIYEDKPRKGASLLSIKKRFFAATEKLIDQYRTLLDHGDMKTGIQWYIYRLQKDLAAFPATVTISYSKNDFRSRPGDSPALKWLKFRRNLLTSLSKGTVRAELHYRDAMQYYMRDGRFEFLLSWLEAFKTESLQSLAEVESYIARCDKKFDTLFEFTRSGTLTVSQWEEATLEMTGEANALISRQVQIAELFRDRLRVEFRTNIDHLRTHLEQIDANHLTRIINNDKKLHRTQRDKILIFADDWRETMELASGRISLHAALRSFKWQIDHDLKEFRHEIAGDLTTVVLEPLALILSQLEAWKQGQRDEKKLRKLEWKSAREAIEKDFKTLSDKLIQSSKGLPDKKSVWALLPPSPESPETDRFGEMNIPVRRLTQHYLEHNFLSPLHDEIDSLFEDVRNSVFNINDQLSLTLFNIENSNADNAADAFVPQFIVNAIEDIKPEESAIRQKKHELSVKISALLEELFRMLTVDGMVATTVDFGYVSRDARKDLVLSRLGRMGDGIRKFFVEKFLILIYSRSEGIRIARQIATSDEAGSITERALDLVGKVTPDSRVINALPHYYLNLFSGRSSIGENFWVARDSEEKTIARVVEHYLEGHHGGIMVAGERNSGKTALCKRIVEKHFGDNKVFHVFASGDGSSEPDAFAAKLGEVTGINSDLPGIMNSLPHRTVIVIHDLELWWERTSEGMRVVEMIMDMIAAYSDRVLFIINMNIFTSDLIHAANHFRERFIGVIRCTPLSSLELKNMILTRHRSSGLEFSVDNRNGKISEITLARLFNYYFSYADGNPGLAMNAWLNSITSVEGNRLVIKPPRQPDTEVLELLPAVWNVILLQLVLHKRMSLEKLLRVFRNDHPGLEMDLTSLLRAGLAEKRIDGCYALNPYVEPFLVRAFKQKEWL